MYALPPPPCVTAAQYAAAIPGKPKAQVEAALGSTGVRYWASGDALIKQYRRCNGKRFLFLYQRGWSYPLMTKHPIDPKR